MCPLLCTVCPPVVYSVTPCCVQCALCYVQSDPDVYSEPLLCAVRPWYAQSSPYSVECDPGVDRMPPVVYNVTEVCTALPGVYCVTPVVYNVTPACTHCVQC